MATVYNEGTGGGHNFLRVQGDLLQRNLKDGEDDPQARPKARREWNRASHKNEFTKQDETKKSVYYTGVTGKVTAVYISEYEYENKKISTFNVRIEGEEGTDILQVSKDNSDFITLCNMLHEIVVDKVYTIAPWQFYAKDIDKVMRGLSLYQGEKNKENKIKVENYPGFPDMTARFEEGKKLVGDRRSDHFKRIQKDSCFWLIDNALPELKLKFGGKTENVGVFDSCTNVDELKKIVESNPQYQNAAIKYAKDNFNVNLTFAAQEVADDDDLPF